MIIQPREYQQKARHWGNRMLNNKRHPLLVSPTQTGKTPTALMVVQDQILLRKKFLILVPQIEIFSQWENDLSSLKINYGYINDQGVMGKNKDVYLCMYQSLENILTSLPEKFCKQFDIILVDECHHSPAQSYVNIFNHFDWCLRFGLTATPYRLDNLPLGEFYTDMYEAIKISEAIESGYLARPIIHIPDEYKNHVPTVDGINRKIQREHIQEKKIIGDMVQTYKNIFDGLPVIIPCTTHEFAKEVTDMYRNAGWRVDHIHSKLSKVDRKIIINNVKKGVTNILVTVGVGIEGMSIKGLYGIIWMRLTESITIYMQFNGRPSNVTEDKKHFVMVDPVGVSVLHGRPDIDRKWSLDTGYEPGQDNDDEKITMKECPCCGNMNSLENIKCWICKYDFVTQLDAEGNVVKKKKRKLPKFIHGRLVFLDEYDFRGDDERGDSDRDRRNNIDNNSNDNNNSNGEMLIKTKAEKQEILSKRLTGIGVKSKFKEGMKQWG